MFLRLSYRNRVRINKMPNASITTNQNKLLECGTCTASFKQPEHAFHRYIHDLVRSLFAGCKMDNVCNIVHCFFHSLPVFDGAMNILYAFMSFEFAVMA